jgi:Flp pilus assembly CpaE family ATPase
MTSVEKIELKVKKEEEQDESLIENIMTLIKNANDFIDYNGIQKKTAVLRELKYLIGNENYYNNYALISQTIDMLVKIGKGKMKFTLNKKNKFICC